MAIGEHLNEFPDEPITLIEIESEKDNLVINEKALRLLQSLQGKVCVVSMAGN